MGYETFRILYHSYVLPVANWAAGFWGFKNYPALDDAPDDAPNEWIAQMHESRLPKKILHSKIIHGCKAWLGEILEICQDLDIPSQLALSCHFTPMTWNHRRRSLVNARQVWRELAPMK